LLFASLIGTTIEFFDFHIFATVALAFFERTLACHESVHAPIIDGFRRYPRELVLDLLAPLSSSANTAGIASTLVHGLVAMGSVYGLLGSALGRLFPPSVRHAGTSFTLLALGPRPV
jgi:hypothetical protein